MPDLMLPLPGLSSVSDKKVVVNFDGGLLSSDGGVLALRELERRLRLAFEALGVEPPPPLQPLVLQLDVPPGGTWGNPLAYSIDRNLAIRGSGCTYDRDTFHVVPLIWNTTAGLDQDKVFAIVYTRARWKADAAARRAAALATCAAARISATPCVRHSSHGSSPLLRIVLGLSWTSNGRSIGTCTRRARATTRASPSR